LDKEDHKIEIWGGVECSFVRVRNEVYDQLLQNRHENRISDLELFSTLKIKKIRYPLLWERYAADPKNFFNLHESRLNKLQELGIQPVAGLLHHGSGPFFTDLADQDFPSLLAEFAYQSAKRFPWIDFYTPVNEPLTTARFSGLYGIWYPHKTDDISFFKIFFNEIKGTQLSMEAVKSINTNAHLIQTEDLCKIHSTEKLKYQAEFENNRRWMTYDLLLGKFTPGHPLWQYVVDEGFSIKGLEFFIDHKVIPGIVGFNYYVTSERYLDERKSIYPPHYFGGNGIDEYADLEAVRANIPPVLNLKALLGEAWERYHLPMALTEIHMACTREEQLRWLHDAWQTGLELKGEGVDFRAITAWSLLGSYDWNSLLCVKNNCYESGVYDLRSGKARPTALAKMVKTFNSGENYTSPLLEVPGWWKRSNRFIYKNEGESTLIDGESMNQYQNVSPLLITGANGSLGKAFARICDKRGIVYYLTNRNQLDIASEESVRAMLEKLNPWAVINAAGFTRIDEAEEFRIQCTRENITGPVILAKICKKMDIKFVTFSTDQVFNGKKRKPYSVADLTAPLNFYGLSKKLAEQKIRKINPQSLIIRSSFFFNPWHKEDHLYKMLESLGEKHFYLPSDIVHSPVYVPDFVNVVLDLLIDGETGIWHLSSQEEISHYDFARMALDLAGIKENILPAVPCSQLEYMAIRPPYSALKSSYGITLPSLGYALNNFLIELKKESLVLH
jgi:dTDP-4-dehydrorhamnose reductase